MRGSAFAILLLSSITTVSYGQELICTAGDIFTSASLQIEWSLGETMIDSYDDEHILFTQGFHQPEIIQKDKSDILIKIYPNPFDLVFYIDINEIGAENEHFSVVLYDLSGKIILAQDILIGNNEILTADIPDGIYFLKLFDANSNMLKSVKIIKLEQP